MTTRFTLVLGLAAGLVSVLGCGARTGASDAPPDGPPAALETTPVASLPGPPASSAATPSARAAIAVAGGESFSCGAFSCRRFASGSEALRWVLASEDPLIVAFGESHALADGPKGKTSAQRFADDLLSQLEGRASAVVLELWAPDPSCDQKKVETARREQKAVVEKQAKTNQNDYVRIGEQSRAIGIVPFLLKPSCDDYDQIQRAGQDAVLAMIDVITRNMKARVEKLFAETAEKQPGKLVVTYGGALHNDVAPRPGREQWSFAADLSALAGGRYVEVDLVVPEAIRDTVSWRSLLWFDAYDTEKFGKSVVLLSQGPHSFVLFFAREPAAP